MKKSVTIAVFSYELWRHPRAIKIAKTLTKQGFKIKLWGSRKPIKKGPRLIRGFLNYIFAMFEVMAIKANILWIENVPDIIFLFLFLLKGDKKIIYDRRSPWAKEVKAEFKSNILYKISEVVERYIIKKASKIVVASSPMRLEYPSLKDAVVIPNFPEKTFTKNDNKENIESIEGKKIFLYVGKISIVEGAAILIDVAKKLCNRYNNVAELWIVGDGPVGTFVNSIAKKCRNIKFFGWVKREYVPRYIKLADYGLVPRNKNMLSVFFNHEGIHKIGEYISYKKPVMACGVAPSPYYLNVNPSDCSKVIEELIKGNVKVKEPPNIPSWEEYSEKKVAEIINEIFKM